MSQSKHQRRFVTIWAREIDDRIVSELSKIADEGIDEVWKPYPKKYQENIKSFLQGQQCLKLRYIRIPKKKYENIHDLASFKKVMKDADIPNNIIDQIHQDSDQDHIFIYELGKRDLLPVQKEYLENFENFTFAFKYPEHGYIDKYLDDYLGETQTQSKDVDADGFLQYLERHGRNISQVMKEFIKEHIFDISRLLRGRRSPGIIRTKLNKYLSEYRIYNN